MSDPIRYRGAFIPVPNPIPALLTDPLSGQDRSLCWADDWNPAIIMALKVLCRPETWSGDEAEIELAMLNAQELIAAIVDGCGSVPAIPFACPGDLTTSSSPYGSFSLPFVGIYVAGSGVQQSQANSGSNTYNGIELHIMLPVLTTITNMHITYDMLKGFNMSGLDPLMLLGRDMTNGVYLPGAQNYSFLTSGSDLGYNSGSFTAPTNHIRFELYCDYANPATALPGTGTCRISHVDLVGVQPPGDPSPCG